MLLDLLTFLPPFFSYTSVRMLLACTTSFVFVLAFGPLMIRKLYVLKFGQPIREENCEKLAELHKKKKGTPTMGGALILSSMVVSLLLWMDLRSPFTLILLLTTLCYGTLGALDDLRKIREKHSKGVSAKTKLLVQFGLASMLAVYLLCPGVSEFFQMNSPHAQLGTKTPFMPLSEWSRLLFVPLIKYPIVVAAGGVGLLILIPFFLVTITGFSNAVNLTDGLDGLASGCAVAVAASIAVCAFLSNHQEIANYLNILYIEGIGEVGIYGCAMLGALLGFLWFNSHPAEVFMGDTGSLALGGIIGVSAILLRRELLFALIGAVFVAEAMSVVLQVLSYKYRGKKRIFLCAPLHHHFEYAGMPETKVVIRFWIISFVLALLGLISLKLQ